MYNQNTMGMACLTKVGNWLSPIAGLDFLEKRKFITCIGIRTPGLPARSLVTMLTASVTELKERASVMECLCPVNRV
jgi:hypothetical protein